MVSFSTYQPPGVYVEGTAATLVSPGGVPSTTVTIVGTARGYELATDTIAIADTPTALSQTGVLPDSSPAPDLKVTKTDGTVLVENTDYTLVRGAGPSDATTITRVSTSTAVLAGDGVVISYAFADATYYTPQDFTSLTSLENVYGASLVSTTPANPNDSQVNSPLALAARFAFLNGATTVKALAVEPPTADFNLLARFNQAYAKLSEDPTVTLLVPVFAQTAGQTISDYSGSLQSFIGDARSFCETEANNGYGKIAFVGGDTIYDDTTVDFEQIAANNASARVVLAYPYRMSLYNQSLTQSTEVGGPYLAAAYAGVLSAQDPNRGLTRLAINGFNAIPSDLLAIMDKSFKNSLSAAGVCVAERASSGQLVCRHGVTTDPSDLVSSEISVTRSQDILYRMVSDGIENSGLIGDPIDANTTVSVKGIIAGILESAVTDLVISTYLNLQVRQQTPPSGNPAVVECQFTYAPFLPLNFITVSFAMDLTAGIVTDATTTDTTDVTAASGAIS